MGLNRLLAPVVDLLYPRRCIGCGEFRHFLCIACTERLSPTTEGSRCPNCSSRWEGGLNCPRCFQCDRLDALAGAFDMEGPARELVHGLKYRGQLVLAPLMANLMAALGERHRFDVAVPVPLHRSRRNARGFNQAEELLAHLDWPLADGSLVRVRKTDTQVGMRLGERRANVVGAFEWRGPSPGGLTVAIVDDVITTGATANECAAVLRDAGARRVIALAFARANHTMSSTTPIED